MPARSAPKSAKKAAPARKKARSDHDAPAHSAVAPPPRHAETRRPAEAIEVRGARQNNLRGIDVDIPLGKITVITGPSGSGKSSLAFDTIYAEGQRRYIETFSPYTRQFFERMDKPQVDDIRGIPPAIAIEQSNSVRTTRSTVGTMTEINDYLKLFFPRLAVATCPSCKQPVRPDTPQSAAQQAAQTFAGRDVLVTFPVPAPPKADPADFFGFLQQQGFLRVRLYGDIFRTDDPAAFTRKALPAVVDVVHDRVKISGATAPARLLEAVEAAFHFGKGKARVLPADGGGAALDFSRGWHCPTCDLSLREPSPALFSFNNPIGACPACRGFGRTIGIDLDRAMPDKSLSLRGGVVRAFQGSVMEESQHDLLRAAKARGVDLDCPFEDLPQDEQEWVIEGDNKDPEEAWRDGQWYGVRGFFKWCESRLYKMHVRVFLSRYRAYTTCEKCRGGRLQPDALNFHIDGETLPSWWRLPVDRLAERLAALRDRVPAGDATAEMLRAEVENRLRYLDRVGLGYLTLDRAARTLSGGEVERVNLTSCLGASLVNTLFVMDEPSVGLHPRDVGRMIDVMRDLRDKGNTLLVVEHEESVIRAADHLIDIGPGRGQHGGHLVYAGEVGVTQNTGHSLTLDYLSGAKSIPTPAKRRPRKKGHELRLLGARQNNLKKLDVSVPLGLFVCVTGVSGSGKSTLIHDVLHENLLRRKGQTSENEPGQLRDLTGVEKVGEVVMVDQSPLSRTPRSTPAVYIGAWDGIRALFAATPEAKAEGLTPSYFSFNSGTGRCQRCQGAGFEKVEMQFLSDLFVTCPACDGTRFTAAARRHRLDGKSVNEVLDLTVAEAVDFLREKSPPAAAKLQLLADVGLDYLKLGQPLNTLSGGESQRLKLVAHLAESSRQASSLLIFDEPTTGLHFDDIRLLLEVFHRLVEAGNSLVVIEHNLDVIKNADWVIDLGPEAGEAGGHLVAQGTPEQVAQCAGSHTGRYLAEMVVPALERSGNKTTIHRHDQSRTPASTQGSLLEAALAELAPDLRTIRTQPPSESLRGNTAEMERQLAQLVNWAQGQGLIFDESRLGPRLDGGGEHDVHAPASPERLARVFKVTVPGYCGATARAFVLRGGGTRIAQDDALPSEYLLRMWWHNRLFGDDVRFEGVMLDRRGVRLVISQPVREGDIPDPDEVRAMLERFDFSRLADGNWNSSADGLTLVDTKCSNFIRRADGLLQPIAVVVFLPTEAMSEAWSLSPGRLPDAPLEPTPAAHSRTISIHGAKEHNLKNISVDIPRDEFVVITGLSGSGKSTLAFDILFAEGQRRFLDSMSPYARQFVEQLERPDVDHISGLPPTVAIEQRMTRGGGKSTVATVTEVYHFLRLLYSKVGVQFCPKCDVPVTQQTVAEIAEAIAAMAKKGAIKVLATVVKARKGFHTEVADWAVRQGFKELLVDGQFVPAAAFRKLERFREHTIDVVVAALAKGTPSLHQLERIVEQALEAGKGALRVQDHTRRFRVFSREMSCAGCGMAFEPLDPRLFSFNSPHGWCPDCRGFGTVPERRDITPDRPDESLLEAELRDELRHEDDEAEHVTCPACEGSRLNRIARAVRVKGVRMEELVTLSIAELRETVSQLEFAGRDAVISRDIVTEIAQRMHFMEKVGLGYLQLGRAARTLSGGESQRIRLAAQLGSNLRGVLYILDEPTIGLHPRDNARLLDTLTALRDKGNSVVVVEHDEDTMRRADHIFDLGPGAGMFGGELVAQGSLAEVCAVDASPTGQAMRMQLRHPLRGERRPVVLPQPGAKGRKKATAASPCLTVTGASLHNLRDLTVSIPLQRLTVLTGVSGSGKSSFMRGVLHPAVRSVIAKAKSGKAPTWGTISGAEAIGAIYEVDQSPIGKTSRSTPATYIGVFDEIRKLFAALPEARMRGYTSGRFSFNTEGGRCEACKGNGQVKLEMAFLPTSWIPCDECHGLRYNAATLEVEYNGKNIGQVMNLTLDEAADFFAAVPSIARTLRLLSDTGVGYLRLGQPSPTLSGGEAQRIKLVTELTRGLGRSERTRLRQNKTPKGSLYLIEEPTIGLHLQDVRKLIDVLHHLVEDGHTVVVIEHNLTLVAEADWVIDIGPEAGDGGGSIVAQGTPEQVAQAAESRTAPFLAGVLAAGKK